METTLIITANAIFLARLYIQQKRLRAYEQYCMQYHKVKKTANKELEKIDPIEHNGIIQSILNEGYF